MGGPGFFGLRLGAEWLVIAIRGAADWMSAKGRQVGDPFHKDYGRDRPWLADWDRKCPDQLSAHLVGQTLVSIVVERHSLTILFENGFDLTIDKSYEQRPIFQGSREPRRFNADDDLRKAVFLAPTTEIWV